MKEITEDHVSIETAKLLKEKGFDVRCRSYYHHDDYLSFEHPKGFVSVDDVYLLRPTHQMALKWLREVHNIYIDILTYTTGKNIQFRWVGYDKGRLFSQEEGKTIYFESYEKAVEAACLYILKNLI